MLHYSNTPAAILEHGSAALEGGSATPTQSAAANSTSAHGQDLQTIFEQENDEGPKDEQEAFEHLRLRQIIQRDHLVDNILGSLQKGVTTHSHYQIFANITRLFPFWNLLR